MKYEALNPKSEGRTKVKNSNYDLEERTLKFARRVREYVKLLPKTPANLEDIKQLVRSSGSVGANYIEANESLSKRDFAHRIRISRKEAKESRYWLQLLDTGGNESLRQEGSVLAQEAGELMLIFAAILKKVSAHA